MLNIIMKAIINFLAIYGVVSLIISIVEFASRKKLAKNTKIKMVLILKDQQEVVEGVVKSLLDGALAKNIVQNNGLNIVDMGSNDESLKILKKMKKSYETINIYDKSERERVFDGFE